jgi:hypothetical protein
MKIYDASDHTAAATSSKTVNKQTNARHPLAFDCEMMRIDSRLYRMRRGRLQLTFGSEVEDGAVGTWPCA